jgi:hypothetical protein
MEGDAIINVGVTGETTMGRPMSCTVLRYRKETARVFLPLVCGLIIWGCADSPTKPRKEPPLPKTVVEILADAYERRDIDRYEACLSDGFLHSFNKCDTCSPPLVIQIEKEDELECARKVFECPCVSRIDMELPITHGPWPTETGLGYRLDPYIRITIGETEPAGTTSVSWAELKLLFAEDEITCEPWVYWVCSTCLYAELIVDPADSERFIVSEILEDWMWSGSRTRLQQCRAEIPLGAVRQKGDDPVVAVIHMKRSEDIGSR